MAGESGAEAGARVGLEEGAGREFTADPSSIHCSCLVPQGAAPGQLSTGGLLTGGAWTGGGAAGAGG